jgi:hypothetical protein
MRYEVGTWHGESGSLFYVTDTESHEHRDDMDDVVKTFRNDRDAAEALAYRLNYEYEQYKKGW